MKKAIAILGFLVLASQVALGSVSALFICLCQGELTHQEPCRPAENDETTCYHDQSVNVAAHAKESVDCEPCHDLLITNPDDLTIALPDDFVFVKAPFASAAASYHWMESAFRRDASRPLAERRSSTWIPKSSEAYTRTVKLLC